MNKKIKQLWDDSIEEFSKQHQYATIMLPEPLREKFAELIVQECADICNKIYFDRYPDAEDFERSEEGDAIKQHFGVEE